MEGFGRPIVYPTRAQICDVNRRMVDAYGGTFVPPQNLLNMGSLEHTLELVAVPVFGAILYPSLEEKAAVLMHHIITGHVFFDGNKRTAVHSAWAFLRSNEVLVFLDRTIVDLAAQVAAGEATLQDVIAWWQDHQQK